MLKKLSAYLLFVWSLLPLLAISGEQLILHKEFIGRNIKSAAVIDDWRLQKYWGGEISRERGALKLKSTLERGKVFGRIRCPFRTGNLSGAKIKLQYKVKGSGNIRFGAIRYQNGKKSPDSTDYLWSDLMSLDKDYRDYEFTVDFSKQQLSFVNFIFEIQGEGEAVIDSMSVKYIGDVEVVINAPAPVMLKDADTLPDVKFQTNRPGRKFLFFNSVPEKIQPQLAGSVTADKQGIVTVPGKSLLQDQVVQQLFLILEGNAMFQQPVGSGCRRCEVIMDSNKTVASMVITRIPAAEYDAALQAAKQAKLGNIKTILVLADSIWDFDRGTNAADRMNFFLQKAHGKDIKVVNYAVHGDRIDRITARFKGNFAEVVHGKNRYSNLKDEQPDLILIMLGHNDTVASSLTGFAKPAVTPEVQKAQYDELLTALKNKYPQCKIILLSPLAVNYEGILKRCEAQKQAGAKVIVRFGDADKVDAFCKTLRETASQYNLPVFDIYTPTLRLSDKASFFRPDNVHLSYRGFGLLNQLVLEELGNLR